MISTSDRQINLCFSSEESRCHAALQCHGSRKSRWSGRSVGRKFQGLVDGYKNTKLNPDYIVETASPSALKGLALPALKNGISIVTLSIGALADTDFYEAVKQTALENDTCVHIASGAIGGLDVLKTVSLMEESEVTFTTEKGPNALKKQKCTKIVYKPKNGKFLEVTLRKPLHFFRPMSMWRLLQHWLR